MWEESPKRVENTGQKRNCSLRAISLFPSVFKSLVLQTRKNKDLFRKGFNDTFLTMEIVLKKTICYFTVSPRVSMWQKTIIKPFQNDKV